MTEQATRTCDACGETKPLIAFPPRRKRCQACLDAAKAKVQAKKEAVTWTPDLGERITDAIAAGIPVSEICSAAGMPTPRQLSRWRRTIPEFADAYEQARIDRADARSDRVDEALRDLRDGKITAADCRVIVETEIKMASRENPARYADVSRADVTVRPGAPAPESVDVTKAWIARVVAGAQVGSNVIKLVPQRSRDEEEETDAVRDA